MCFGQFPASDAPAVAALGKALCLPRFDHGRCLALAFDSLNFAAALILITWP